MSAAVSVVAVLGAGASLAATPAQAESAWWHLETASRPTYLQPGQARDEVQELTVLGGSLFIVSPELTALQIEEEEWGPPGGGPLRTPTITAASTPAEIAAGLEALNGYGAGSVEVEQTAAASFKVTFVGPLAGSPIALMRPGYPGQGTFTELTRGRPDGEIYLTAENIGETSLTGANSPMKLTDVLPAGLEALAISANRPELGNFLHRQPLPCDLATLTCELAKTPLGSASIDSIAPFDIVSMRIAVDVEPGFQSLGPNEARVSGGQAFTCHPVAPGTGAFFDGACAQEIPSAAQGFERTLLAPVAPATLRRPLTLSSAPVPFGVEHYGLDHEEEGGAPATQAGSHPFQQTTTITLNQTADSSPPPSTSEKPHVNPAALAKDVHFRWPPGLLGNPTNFAHCTDAQFFASTESGQTNRCPASSSLGVTTVTINEPSIVSFGELTVPLFNLAPHYGEPARLGFNIVQANAPVVIDPALRSALGPGGAEPDYGITVQTDNITQTAAFLAASATVWGVPGDRRHNFSRGYACQLESRGAPVEKIPTCAATATLPSAPPQPPFLSMPTTCAAPLSTDVEADPWVQAGVFALFPGTFSPSGPLTGCNRVPFNPQIESEPTSNAATSPTGLGFDINVDDEGQTNGQGLVQSQIKKAVVTLPQGFTTNPSVAEGLKACPQAAYQGSSIDGSVACPEESKVGEVEIESPLVKPVVHGSLYVAKQGENPNANNLLTIYLVARSPEIGVIVKQALKVIPNPVTGQLTTEVDNIPQLPFSHFHLEFRSGQRAPLITPPACGIYTVTADLYPYSNPGVPVHRESSFQITSGPEGQPCPSGNTPPFHPVLEAGTINNAAGTYSPFYTHITRKDSEQEITHFSIKLPPGVIGKLAGVSSCSDAQIAAAKAREHEGGGTEEEQNPSCPANSEVGHSLVGSGVGNVLAYAPGKLYLAGPYHGSNISLVSITAAKVGPFDLGTVVVRFALKIDPETAEVFVDGQGSDPIPHIVDGIPVHLRDIRAYVDRPNFTLNPTSCAKKSTASTVLGSGLNFASEADDQPVTVTSPFQAADCANLGFAPKLALSLKGGTKRGATPAFKAVLTYPKGSYANIAKSVVTLPHSEFLEQSHIKTICTRVQFKEGKVPGEKCPAASIYGRAEAVTPLLSEPLKGPVYLRSSSHNLPDLVAALHNNQVDFALDGRIDSVKNGRIRNTFETVPDAPVSKFVLEMQGGKKGLLVNSTNLCKGTNRAISEFTGQNGKLYNTNPVLAAKCAKAKKKGKRHR